MFVTFPVSSMRSRDSHDSEWSSVFFTMVVADVLRPSRVTPRDFMIQASPARDHEPSLKPPCESNVHDLI
jgi:hypothetical protein